MVVIEVVTFELTQGSDEASFLSAVEDSNNFLRAQPGFLNRELGKRSHGVDWIDTIHWQDLPMALAAAERFNSSPHTRKFNSMLQKGTVNMSHYIISAVTSAV